MLAQLWRGAAAAASAFLLEGLVGAGGASVLGGGISGAYAGMA